MAANPSPALHVNDATVGVEHAFVHHFRQRRMREDRVHQLFFGRFAVHRHDKALDQLGDFGADHVGAQQLAGLLVEDGLDHAIRLAKRDGLAIAGTRNRPTLISRPCSLAFASVRPTLATCGWQ